MWKHEIKNFCSVEPERANKSSINKQNITVIKNVLKDSVAFFFGDLSNYDNVNVEDFDFTNIPASKTLVEYTDNRYLSNPPLEKKGEMTVFNCTKRATLFSKKEDDKDNVIVFNFSYLPIFKQWVVTPVAALIKDHNVYTCELGEISEINRKGYNDNLSCAIGIAIRLFQVLNAKNIITKSVTPPSQLNKKRIKHKKDPLEKYYILEVAKGIPKTKYQGEVPWDYRSPKEQAFHFCRGHFKTYTEEAPLFGKYTGTFWWQPSMRGKKENGIIHKDYAITMNDTGA